MQFAPEVEEWVKELGLTAEQRSALEPVFGQPELQEKVKGSVLRQSEFTRRMQALDKQKADLEAAIAQREAKVIKDAQDLGTWKEQADSTIVANRKALEDAQLKHFQLQQRMTALATQYGVDPKEWGVDEQAKPPATQSPATGDAEPDKRYFTREEAQKFATEIKVTPYVAAEIEDIVDEHRALFGKGLSRRELVANAQKNNRSLREEWETSHEVAKRRQEIEEKKIEERINTRVAEERTKILSEHKLPVTRGAESGSPLLAMRDDLKLAGTDRSTKQGASAVDAAVSAFNAGKYRNIPAPETKTA